MNWLIVVAAAVVVLVGLAALLMQAWPDLSEPLGWDAEEDDD